MRRKKLPIGKSTFRNIRDPKENYVYIDKTAIAYEMVTSGSYYFLSRPRRFGKSLFIDTLWTLWENSVVFYDLSDLCERSERAKKRLEYKMH